MLTPPVAYELNSNHLQKGGSIFVDRLPSSQVSGLKVSGTPPAGQLLLAPVHGKHLPNPEVVDCNRVTSALAM